MKQCTNRACGYLEENDTAGFCGICGGELVRTGGLAADRWGEVPDDMAGRRLSDLVSRQGWAVFDDPLTGEGLLREELGEDHLFEANLLAAALREGIVQDLPGRGETVDEMEIERLAKRLTERFGYPRGHARWSVESWADASLAAPLAAPAGGPSPFTAMIERIGAVTRRQVITALSVTVALVLIIVGSVFLVKWYYQKTALDWNDRGMAAYRQKEYEKAVDCFTESIGYNKELWDAYINRGNASTALKRYDNAVRDFDIALAFLPKDKKALEGKGLAHRGRGAFLLDERKYKEAASDYTIAIDLLGGDTDTYRKRGDAYLGMKEYAKAKEDYTRVISSIPDDPALLAKRGDAYLGMKRHTEAIADYEKALTITPGSPELLNKREIAYRGRADYTYDQGRNADAVTYLTEVMKLFGNEADLYYKRGDAYLKMDKFTEAIADFDRTLKQDSSYYRAKEGKGDAYRGRADRYYNANKYSSAASDYTEAVRYLGADADLYYYRANCYRYLKNYASAIADYERVLNIDSDYSGARDNKTECHKMRGESFFNGGRYRDAINDFSEVVAYSPSGYYYNQIGRAYFHLGDYGTSISNYSEAIRIETDGSNKSIYYQNRGLSFYKNGSNHKAIEDYNQAISLDPKYAAAYNNRGCASMDLGYRDDAMWDFRKACELGEQLGCDNYNKNIR